MAKKVADQLVDTLEKAGVRRIYAVTGDSLNEVNEAVRKNGRLRWMPMHGLKQINIVIIALK